MSSFERLPNQEDDSIAINNEKDCKKYLTDKLSGKSEYMYILNAIKDHYIN